MLIELAHTRRLKRMPIHQPKLTQEPFQDGRWMQRPLAEAMMVGGLGKQFAVELLEQWIALQERFKKFQEVRLGGEETQFSEIGNRFGVGEFRIKLAQLPVDLRFRFHQDFGGFVQELGSEEGDEGLTLRWTEVLNLRGFPIGQPANRAIDEDAELAVFHPLRAEQTRQMLCPHDMIRLHDLLEQIHQNALALELSRGTY